ncbi:geranylgeranyl reductase family protein [Cellulomonas endophytica]|uniref:geranylgeranyl reductase family protein n=1 Tax=Cellulomonas endophytica TaxID=2494735 RepID=UPI001F0C2717|nr:geranylgeranyl reductase family protein [Cellulomonas endophytica]
MRADAEPPGAAPDRSVGEEWDVVVVGAGPAGATAALAALRERPGARVLLLDRYDFPRDKACGDGVAPHTLDVLAGLGVTGLLDDRVPVPDLHLDAGPVAVTGTMARPALVVPRAALDARLVAAAVAAGATLRRHRVRTVATTPDGVVLDGVVRARVVVAADGVHSAVRRAVGGGPSGRTALALRGYAPTRREDRGRQVIRFGGGRGLGYAWAFDRGDGLANVGYGETLDPRGGPVPTRAHLLERLDALLPGAADGATGWRAAHLPLTPARLPHPRGRVLLAGDAAALVNPLSGEGIYYAVASGALAGRVAAAPPPDPGATYGRALRRLLGRHSATTAGLARLVDVPGVLPAAVRAARRDPRVFDALVETALGPGVPGPRVLGGVLAALAGDRARGRGRVPEGAVHGTAGPVGGRAR